MADNVIRLAKAGTAVGDNKSTVVVWPSTEGAITYGSPTDLWGTTWTPAEINASGFGATLNPLNTGNGENAWVDYHQIIVYYTLPGSTCNGAIGDVCGDGTVYAGLTPDAHGPARREPAG